MISTLHIKNIGIIDDLSIDLGKGFNVFTGETGAGKTLIIDAINVISGGRFSKEMIRKGEDFSFVELNLYMPNNKNAIENNITISREIHLNGRNSCKINGRLVTVNELKEFMSEIIDIHGQNDNQKILNCKNHIKYLDDFCENEMSDILNQYKEKYLKYIELKKELKNNLGDDKEKQRRLDLLQYELEEIDKANLKIGEDIELKDKSIMFENSEKIATNLNEVSAKSENAVDFINQAIKAMDKISNLNDSFNNQLITLKNIYYEIEEFSRDVNANNEDLYFDEEERDEVEKRLDLISSLKRKYGNSIEEILNFRNEIADEIAKIDNLSTYNEELKKEICLIEKDMKLLSDKLNSIRIKYADILSDKINEELKDLEMKNAKFFVKIEETEKYNSRGKNNIQFFIATNIGEDMKELDKIASGGEMSRIMLAIKTVLANTDSTPVMIFDEVDTGISGKAAKSVASKLKYIGCKHQVICITHQPSIAAKGDENYFISKATNNNRTFTKIKLLDENEIIDEIARISNGDITEIARKHALELRKAV